MASCQSRKRSNRTDSQGARRLPDLSFFEPESHSNKQISRHPQLGTPSYEPIKAALKREEFILTLFCFCPERDVVSQKGGIVRYCDHPWHPATQAWRTPCRRQKSLRRSHRRHRAALVTHWPRESRDRLGWVRQRQSQSDILQISAFCLFC